MVVGMVVDFVISGVILLSVIGVFVFGVVVMLIEYFVWLMFLLMVRSLLVVVIMMLVDLLDGLLVVELFVVWGLILGRLNSFEFMMF